MSSLILGGLLALVAASDPLYVRPTTAPEEVAKLREEIAAAQADPSRWHQTLATYLALGELESISELIELLVATFPDDPIFLEGRMMFLSQSGEHEAAIALGESILARFPEHPTIRVNLARVFLKTEQRAAGVNLLVAAIERGPIRVEDWSLLLQGLGLVGAKPDPPEQVVATLRRKVAEHPQHRGLAYVLMVVLVRTGHYAEAKAILEHNPDLADHPDLQAFVASLAR